MKSGPCLRVEEPVAVAAVFDGRLTLTNVRRYVAHHLAVCSAPQHHHRVPARSRTACRSSS